MLYLKGGNFAAWPGGFELYAMTSLSGCCPSDMTPALDKLEKLIFSSDL